ncbi:hypothetical protein [Nitrosopumilus sp.]|uniref:hypothetical protein n=1 Tax=Nitrosopumilus sp. TaxID=2024843 RepID=UPI00292CCC8F|nr:hypothetical protein [Nitrosopumilus sp.]
MKYYLLFALLVLPFLMPQAFAHTVDSVGEYRVEIGWMNEPVVSSETNAIEFYVSPLEPNLDLEDQKFQNGVTGLKKTVKMQLVYKDQNITLPLSPDHDIPGKYYAFVNPTISGFYQANILGTIEDTQISLSMHPPKVEERSYIEFPLKETEEKKQIIESQNTLKHDISSIKSEITQMQKPNLFDGLGYLGITFGIVGMGVASGVMVKTRRKTR